MTSLNSNGETGQSHWHKDYRAVLKNSQSFWKFTLVTYNDKLLLLLTSTVLISLVIALYQELSKKHSVGDTSRGLIQSVTILVAISIVVLVGSLNDWQKDQQFSRLNRRMASEVLHLEPEDVVPTDGTTGKAGLVSKEPAEKASADIKAGKFTTEPSSFVRASSCDTAEEGTLLCRRTGALIPLHEQVELTPLQSKLNRIAERLAMFGGVAGLTLLVILLVIFCTKLPQNTTTASAKAREVLDMFIIVVAFIIVIVPEGLPLALTLAVASVTTRIQRSNNLIPHRKACEVIGNATSICVNMTGTLTQNGIVVAAAVGTRRHLHCTQSASTERLAHAEFIAGLAKDSRNLLFEAISLSSTALEGDKDGVSTFIGSKTETALLKSARSFLAMESLSKDHTNVEILQTSLEPNRDCIGVVVQLENGNARLYAQGAPETLLAKCKMFLKRPDTDISSDPLASDGKPIMALIEEYASQPLTSIGFAYRDFAEWPLQGARHSKHNNKGALFEDLFDNMCFIGLVGIKHALRPGVPEAVREYQRAGVFVRMVTGDNTPTARAIANECGILRDEGTIMEGSEFRKLIQDHQNKIPRLQVLACSTPDDEVLLVQRLKALGEIVAVIGDGTNNAPALKQADVALSIGNTDTDVAKGASAIIEVESFPSTVKALRWGRAINDAVKRFLQFQLTITITVAVLVFFTAVASAHQESLFTAVQLLWVNLIMDTLAALALVTGPPENTMPDSTANSRGSGIISSAMWKMIIGQALYQLAVTFGLEYMATRLVEAEEQRYMRALVFNTFVWMQIFNLWNNRRSDNKLNIFEGLTRHWFFIVISLILGGAQVLIISFGGTPFSIPTITPKGRPPQSSLQWGIAVGFGLVSIPVGIVIRCFPDKLILKCVPRFLKVRRYTVDRSQDFDDEISSSSAENSASVKNDLGFLKKFKGGRVVNLKFA
ncbi:uncharacterized protein B0I36DRAFT_256913, partial [Microdochium trichocladiopsis]